MSQLSLDFRPRRSKKPFNLHHFLLAVITVKLIGIEILSTVVFFRWLLHVFFSEVRLH